jgi:hypothetical protein
MRRTGGRHLAFAKTFFFAKEGRSGGLGRAVWASSFLLLVPPNGDNGCRSCDSGDVVRDGTSGRSHRRWGLSGSCRSSERMRSGSSRACSRVLSCCRSWQATCGCGCSKDLHSLNGGHAHHDARRDWLAGVNQSNLRMAVDGRHPGLEKGSAHHEGAFTEPG